MISIEKLHESATRMTGLQDFGDKSYLEGLQVLAESYEREAQLTELGEKILRAFVRGAIAARAISEAGWQSNPSYADVPISRPIFVLGLPRTGTTALHRLLTADPAHQGLEVWLAEVPQPRPPRDTWEENPVFATIQATYKQQHLASPEFMGLHYMDAAEVEECWKLLQQSMMSHYFECLAHIPSYSKWLQAQDMTPAYARHKRNLQLIGLADPGKRWVLKFPAHIFSLNALLAVYPDALIVQTHRDPRTAIASVCSLNAAASKGWSTLYEGDVVGRDQLELWGRGLRQFNDDRATHRPEQFVDVHYEDFVRDPLAAAESVYRALGEPLSDAARAAMQALHTESQTGGRKPAHKYSLADFGLTEAEVQERFS